MIENGFEIFNGINSKKEREVGDWIDGKSKFYINTIEAIWVSAAILAYEKYNITDKPTTDDMYFSQADIVNRAKDIHGANVQSALASTHTVASHKDTNYNFLVEGKSNLEKYRRVSYAMEFDGIKEKPEIDMNIIIESSLGDITIRDLFDFVNNKYTNLFNGASLNNKIDIESIERYLINNAGKDYKKPDKAGEKANEMLKLRENGIYAREQFIELAKEAIKTFKDYEMGTCSNWVNQGQTVPDYFWIEFKKVGYKEIKSSISLFAWKVGNSYLI